MARLPDTFNIGNIENMNNEHLLVILQRMYVDLAEAINAKPDLVERNENGQTTDTFLSQGTLNINLSTNKVEMLTNHIDPSTVVWTTLS